ncbi:hypothetical protein MHYP_G00244440 [Metynnis hypsauchen]
MRIKEAKGFFTFSHNSHLIYACCPAWDIGHQAAPSRHHGSERFSTCPHVSPIRLASASRSRRQVFLGRQLFLFPCRFQDDLVNRLLLGFLPQFLIIDLVGPADLPEASVSSWW